MMKIVETDWHRDEDALRAIRSAVFIDEQQVPPALEWDGEDENACHWLAVDEEGPAGTVRLLRSGHIGRMAVLARARRRGIARALLHAAIDKARELNLREVFLYAQTHAQGFYAAEGFVAGGAEFMDAGIPHITMRRLLREAYELGRDSGRHAISDASDTACSLISQCRHQLCIVSQALEPDIYDNPRIEEAVSRLARLHRNSEIRLLVCDSRELATYGHRLLSLAQRLSSAIKIRVIDKQLASQLTETFLVADKLGLMVLNRVEPEQRWADFNNVPVAKTYADQFEELWHSAHEDPRLRRLVI